MEAIQVVGMKPAWGLPSPSPFCLKLETWLRMEKIPYNCLFLTKFPQSSTGKLPYLQFIDGSTLADSNVIIETLAKERGIDLAHGASPDNQARAHVILRTIEESLYFCGVWERWLHPEFWPVTRESYFGELPRSVRPLVAGLLRRKIRALLYGQGIARHEPARITALACGDVEALAVLLGQRPFFLGERPGVVDASAYGLLANVLAYPGRTPLKLAVESHSNLVDFCGRIKSMVWSEQGSADNAEPFGLHTGKRVA